MVKIRDETLPLHYKRGRLRTFPHPRKPEGQFLTIVPFVAFCDPVIGILETFIDFYTLK
jgi:hypothetical protein